MFCNNSSVKCQNFWKICKTHDKKIAALCENVINKRRYVFFSAFFRKIENYSDTSALLHFLSFFPRMQTLKNDGYKYFLKSHSNLFTWYAISIVNTYFNIILIFKRKYLVKFWGCKNLPKFRYSEKAKNFKIISNFVLTLISNSPKSGGSFLNFVAFLRYMIFKIQENCNVKIKFAQLYEAQMNSLNIYFYTKFSIKKCQCHDQYPI